METWKSGNIKTWKHENFKISLKKSWHGSKAAAGVRPDFSSQFSQFSISNVPSSNSQFPIPNSQFTIPHFTLAQDAQDAQDSQDAQDAQDA